MISRKRSKISKSCIQVLILSFRIPWTKSEAYNPTHIGGGYILRWMHVADTLLKACVCLLHNICKKFEKKFKKLHSPVENDRYYT